MDLRSTQILVPAAQSFTDEFLDTAVLTVRRSGGTTGAVSVVFETIDGSATAGADYVSQLGRLEWANGDATDRTITLTLLNDANDEPASPEQFVVRLSGATGGAMLAASDATISISLTSPCCCSSSR